MRDPASYLLIVLIGGGEDAPVRSTGDQLSRLAAKVERLTPSHRDPERFHEEKSEVVAELRRLARERRA